MHATPRGSTPDTTALLNAIGGVVWEFDWSTGTFLWVSDACERLLGFPRDEWLRPGFWMDRVHPDDARSAQEFCRASTASGEDHTFEYRMIHADGRTVWVRDIVTVDPVLRLDGVLRGLFVDISDTKRKAAQFDAIFRLSQDLFLRIDQDGVIVDFAAPEETLTVITEQYVGRNLSQVLPRDVVDVLSASIAETHRTGATSVGEYSLAINGGTLDWEARLLPLWDGETAVICREVTERNRRDRELRQQRDELDGALARLWESLERFRSVIHQAPIGVYVYEARDEDLVLSMVNPAADRIIGIGHGERLGLRIEDAFPEGGSWIDDFRRLARDGGSVHFEVEYQDAEVAGVYDVTAFQTVPGQVAVMFFDISQRKAAEEAERDHARRVSALAAQIASAEDAERRRLAEELHDRVGQPLAVARMRLATALADCDEHPADIGIGMDMLDRALGETRTITSELYPPLLRELGLAAALDWLTTEYCRLHGLTCEANLADPGDQLHEELQSFLFRAARELLMNVVKHAATKKVWVSLDVLGPEVALTVADEGAGFDPSEVERSSESGFGLFSLGERIGYLGGTMEVESEPGEGTRITITVPTSG